MSARQKTGGRAASPGVDEKDMGILKALEKDARASVRSLASQTGIKPSTVHSRLDRMIKKGVIEGFTVKVNPEYSGGQLTVFMLVTGSAGKYLEKDGLRDDCIEEVYGITGEYDLMMKLRFRDLKAFNRFIIGFREKHKGSITRTITMVETARLK